MAVTKPAGTWTYEDLFSLPDDGRRYEIIEGKLYEMPAPAFVDALIITNLMLLLGPTIEKVRGWLVSAPVDVFFEGANPVGPDIIIFLPESRAHAVPRGVEGPPDLLIEVLSPSNRSHDLLTKRALYARAGVREYWIVDPENRTVDVLTLDGGLLRSAVSTPAEDDVASPLLGTSFPLAAIFARIDEIGV